MRRRSRRVERPLINPIEMAIDRARKLAASRRVELIAPGRVAIETLVDGRGSVVVWQQCADICNLAEALCELRIANNLAPTVAAAQAVRATLLDRVRAGDGWLVTSLEGAALREALWLYGVQLDHCSAGEHLRAMQMVRNRIGGVLAGNASPRAKVHAAFDEADD